MARQGIWDTVNDPFGFMRPDPNYFPTDLLHHLTPGLAKPRRGLYQIPRTLPEDPTVFRIHINVKHFYPEELEVRIVDKHVVVTARHEEQPDEHGFVTRSFVRRYRIPEDVLYDEVKSSLSQDGVLSIQGPKVVEPLAPHKGRMVPVEYERPPPPVEQGAAKSDGNIGSLLASRFRI